MPEPRNEKRTPPNYEDTMNPAHPPGSLMSRSSRRTFFWSYFGPIVVLFLVVAVGFFYFWVRRNTSPTNPSTERTYAVGTTGTEHDGDYGYKYDYKPGSSPGGSDPQDVVGHRDDAASELHRRGADGFSQGPNQPLYDAKPLTKLGEVLQQSKDVAGRPVDVSNVTVDSAQGHTFWVRDRDMKVEVVAPEDSPTLSSGMRVHIVGTVQQGANGRPRIQASRVDVNRAK